MLIVFSGLPGSGKSTLASRLAAKLPALYLRIDSIEQAIRDALPSAPDIGPAGYAAALAIARSNLALGASVVADCVNPVAESRAAWRDAAETAGVALIDIEIVCSDEHEHRRRVETRTSDIPGLVLPSWQAVQSREYQPWITERLVIDTATLAPQDAQRAIMRHIEWRMGAPD